MALARSAELTRERPRRLRAVEQSAAGEELSELVVAAQRGDREAFALLYQRYRPMVHALLLARVSPLEASDLVQDVFVLALRRIGELRKPAAIGAWLGRIARNRAVDYHRSRRKVADPVDVAVEPPPTTEAVQAMEAVRSLPSAYGEILIMRLVYGMTGPEIAERTGMTPGSVRVNLHRGMKLLRAALGMEAER